MLGWTCIIFLKYADLFVQPDHSFITGLFSYIPRHSALPRQLKKIRAAGYENITGLNRAANFHGQQTEGRLPYGVEEL